MKIATVEMNSLHRNERFVSLILLQIKLVIRRDKESTWKGVIDQVNRRSHTRTHLNMEK